LQVEKVDVEVEVKVGEEERVSAVLPFGAEGALLPPWPVEGEVQQLMFQIGGAF
jgi:hypothetical protein